MIDGHVHIRAARLCGNPDPPTGATLLEYGRLKLSDGRIVQFMPPYFADSRFDEKTLIATMDAYGIEKSVIMQSYAFNMNEEIAEAVRNYPDRLCGSMVLDLGGDVESEVEYCSSRGLRVIKFEMSPVLGYTHQNAFPTMRFDDPLLYSVFELARSNNLTIAIDTNMVGSKGFQVEELHRAVKDYPSVKFVICHLAYAREEYFRDAAKLARWQQMLRIGVYENVWFDISALPDLFSHEEYPYVTAVGLVQAAIEQYTADKFIWGSDIPGTLRNATYKQMISMFDKGLRLPEGEKDKIFFKNAEMVYFGT
ncbi:MAG: amidohydrolase family protein [Bacillota bacterium]|nr:amidohydrolase family protein [Bacillota bacterium]